jgi:hypothetical protein
LLLVYLLAFKTVFILTNKCGLKLYITATEVTKSTEIGVWDGKGISVLSMLSVAESYREQIRLGIQLYSVQIYIYYQVVLFYDNANNNDEICYSIYFIKIYLK